MDEQQRAQCRRELAERSVLPDAGLDRDLAEEIDREAWRLGPRHYTDAQATFIAETVAARRPLPESPLPIDE